MTIKTVSSGSAIDRAQALGLATRYATTRTSEAKVTLLPDGRYQLAIDVVLADVKPFNLNERVRAVKQNGFETSLHYTAAKKPVETSGPVEVGVKGHTLHIEATFENDPSAMLQESKGIDLQFKHPQGLSEFRVDIQLSELKLDRSPAERVAAEKAIEHATTDLEAWRSEFEAAKARAPGEAAALERERTEAARAIDDARAAIARARSAIDQRAASVSTAELAMALRTADDPAGKAWLDARVERDAAMSAHSNAEELAKTRAEVEAAGVSPEDAGLAAAPDLAATRARVDQAQAALDRAELEVREAFKNDPDGRAHLALATVTGKASDRARSDLLAQSVTALEEATIKAQEVARRRVGSSDPAFPQLIAAAEAEVARLEEALATLQPAVASIELGKHGDDTAQRALFGVREGQSWDEWRQETIAARRRD
ncbi:MAG: hypothetical protein JNM17_31130 [Archangium sp.]|nr:hypothetical protein [Archangium sp.]